jgi:protein-S-isoprenylcysteine O-methyltransferase Ste14
MRLRSAALGSALFFLVAPGVVVGVLPWWLTRWKLQPAAWPVRVAGLVLLVLALPVLVGAFARFVRDGLGTPAPVAPTEHLVVTGAYRYVRNPMYLAVMAAIVGQALLLGQPRLLGYAGIVALGVVSFVWLYEEPTLRRQFGAEYEAYRRAVPGWWPRFRPWTGPGQSHRV